MPEEQFALRSLVAKSCREIVHMCACVCVRARAKGEALHVGGSLFNTPISAFVLKRCCCILHRADTCTAASLRAAGDASAAAAALGLT